jgi:hypothetical protein
VRGLRSKICEFYNNICTLEYDIISVTETWLSDDITDDELFCNSYTVYRSDRNFLSLGVKKGGGVLIAVNNKFSSSRLNTATLSDSIPSIDTVGVRISINGSSSMVILVVYIPPYTPFFDFEHYFEILSSMHEIHEDKVIVLGDFNTPTFSTNVYNRSATVLRNFQNVVNFGQYNSILNTSQRILDLVFVNFNCEVLKSNFQLVDEDSYHPALDICFVHQTPKFINFWVNEGASFFNFKTI